MNEDGKRVLIVAHSMRGSSGGEQCMERNLESVKQIFGEENTFIHTVIPVEAHGLEGYRRRLPDLLRGYCAGLDSRQAESLLNLIAEKRIGNVYIDTSFYGKLAKLIKERFPEVKVVTFFHNCEYDYALGKLKADKKFSGTYGAMIIRYNEKMACRYSDRIIVLNDRDRRALLRHYGRRADEVIPITFRSVCDREPDLPPSRPPKALFVGSYFYGNTEGLKWFCREVLPKTDLHFTIVGAGMEQLAEEIGPASNLEIRGRVADLTDFYRQADLVILPILSGGGMKVKTAESLMYGKYIVGTPEAFEGYDITPDVGCECRSAESFISTLGSLRLKSRYNAPSRRLFEEKYSFASSLPLFRRVLKER